MRESEPHTALWAPSSGVVARLAADAVATCLAYTIKQYPAKEQAELRVLVKVPGSWFGGQLTVRGRAQLFTSASRGVRVVRSVRFPEEGLSGEADLPSCGIKFMCESDVFDDPKAPGFDMPLSGVCRTVGSCAIRSRNMSRNQSCNQDHTEHHIAVAVVAVVAVVTVVAV